MIVLFTDFGEDGLYSGQIENVLVQRAPGVPFITLMNSAPCADPRRSSYLLAALLNGFPAGTVFLCVVDPGVGGERLPIVLKADGRWFVGPDNGLLNGVAVNSRQCEWWVIEWRPRHLSASFHGRDLFAPVAAALARDGLPDQCRSWSGPELSEWPGELGEIVYIDHYGNAITGLRYGPELDGAAVSCEQGENIFQAGTFSSVSPGSAFWYCNSMGLVEIAVNLGRADHVLHLQPGSTISMFEPS